MLMAAVCSLATTMPLEYWPVLSSQRTGLVVVRQLDEHAITDELRRRFVKRTNRCSDPDKAPGFANAL